MRKLLAAAACVLTLAVPSVSSAQQAGWQYAYVDGVATATQRDDRGRVTATLTCRPPTGDIVITDYTLARAGRRQTHAAVRIGAMSINVPMQTAGRGRNAAVTINLAEVPELQEVGGIARVAVETGEELGIARVGRTSFVGYRLEEDVLKEIDDFRAQLAEHFITFDPGDVDEKLLLDRGILAAKEGKEFLEVAPHTFGGAKADGAQPIRVRVREILDIAGDVDGQIYMRDFKLVDQSDMIVSYIPEIPDGKGGGIPGLSSGVERELHHAFEHTKEVYVVWKPRKAPSPFITETATKIFASTAEAMTYFESNGMFAATNLFGH